MSSPDLLLTFLLTTALFAFLPGPAMLYAAARTLAGGRRAGLLASLGIHLGGYVHVIAAAAGLSLLFHAVPLAYTAVKLAGAAYLIWLGLSMFRAETPNIPGSVSARNTPFIESIAVEILNPKTAIFFLAFLPQFTDASAGLPIWVQVLLLGTVTNLIFSTADIICVILAGAISARLRRSSHMQKTLRRGGGVIIAGLGLHLALTKS